MLTLGCWVAGCKEQGANTDKDVAIALIAGLKGSGKSPIVNLGGFRGLPSRSSRANKIVKPTRPKITQGTPPDSRRSVQVLWSRLEISLTAMVTPENRVLWSLYKIATDVSQAECGLQLIQCCSEKLVGQLFHADPRVSAKPEFKQLEATFLATRAKFLETSLMALVTPESRG